MSKERRALFIKEWRKFRGDISQDELANRIGMSAGNLSLLERGQINYTQDTLERLADALDCTPVDLITRDPHDGASMWQLWAAADPIQRAQMAAIAETILKPPKG